jgi:formylglycine-generating enzyme required for sulfatase activity
VSIPNKLRKDLVEFIQSIPNIRSDEVKQALLLAAGLDKELLNQVETSKPVKAFSEVLINTLYDYGNLKDGRDPVYAVLLESTNLLGLDADGVKKGERLINSWKNFLERRNISSQIDMTTERQFYLTNLIDDFSELRMSRVLPDQSDPILLTRVYVDVPTDIQLHLEIQNYLITNWWVSAKSSDEQSDLFAFSKSNSNSYDSQTIEHIVTEAQGFIKGEGGNISPLEKERPMILKPFWDNGLKNDYHTLGSFDVATSANRLIFVGDPGSGKSTFAQYLALFLAELQLNTEKGFSTDTESRWPHGPLTPIFIDIRKFVDRDDFPNVDLPITIEYFWHYVSNFLLGLNNKFSHELLDDLIAGRALVIFDGLDEAFAPRGVLHGQEKRIQQLCEFIKKLGKKFSKSRLIVTTRPHEFISVQKEFVKYGFKIAHMEKLQTKQMLLLARNLYASVGLSQIDAELKAKQLNNELVSVSDFLKNRPLFLTLMVMLSLNPKTKRLPSKKGSLLNESVFLLIDRWTKGRLSSTSLQELKQEDTREIFNSLENIAHRAQDHISTVKDQTVSLPIGDIYAEFYGYEQRVFEIVNYLTKQAGILEPVELDPYGKEQFKFSHRSFQEFLAASYLVKQGDYRAVREKIQKTYLQWREPCILIGDLLAEKEPNSVWLLIEELVSVETSEESDYQSWNPIWLASNLIINQKNFIVSSKEKHSSLVDILKGKLRLLLAIPKVLSATDRVECGIALGYLGDNRPGVGLNENGIPDIDWCYVPPTKFLMGLTNDQLILLKGMPWAGEWSYDDEIPGHLVDLPEFYISRYPVTIKQYQAFLKAKDGYWNDEWWTKIGLELRPVLEHPVDATDNLPDNLPQNFVSWFEAIAFCRWLSQKLSLEIKLPSEAEWERAARGVDGRFFPWGNDYDPAYCNVAETGIGGPSPVGCFAFPNKNLGDNTPLDLCGNVWEWCTTIFQKERETPYMYPYSDKDGRETLERGDDSITTTRGGSFTNIPHLARLTFRGRDRPSFKPQRQGFRVMMYKG